MNDYFQINYWLSETIFFGVLLEECIGCFKRSVLECRILDTNQSWCSIVQEE